MNPAADASPYLTGAAVDNAVSLVTSMREGRMNVMTATFFAESSHVPALLRVSIATGSLTHELVSESGWFGLSVLARGQEDWAWECGIRSGRERRKLEALGIPYTPGVSGVPMLPACLTTSECRIVQRVPLPDHTLFVGEIVASYRQTRIAYHDALLVSDLMRFLGLHGLADRPA